MAFGAIHFLEGGGGVITHNSLILKCQTFRLKQKKEKDHQNVLEQPTLRSKSSNFPTEICGDRTPLPSFGPRWSLQCCQTHHPNLSFPEELSINIVIIVTPKIPSFLTIVNWTLCNEISHNNNNNIINNTINVPAKMCSKGYNLKKKKITIISKYLNLQIYI